MSEKLLKILSKYLSSIGKLPKDFTIEYVVDEKYGDYFKFDIDLSKMDVNSPNYDENYAKHFIRRKGLTGLQRFTYDWDKNMRYNIEEFMKISGLSSKYRTIRVFNVIHNYDYMDDIGNKIEEKIKETNYPNVEIEFEKDTNPEIKIVFRKFTIEQFDNYKEFIKELKELLYPKIDLDSYSQSFVHPR
jgi:hypothetical protein